MIVHLSTAAALREVEAARGLGQKVFVETCPHYLLLDDSRYSLPGLCRRTLCLRAPAAQEARQRAPVEGAGRRRDPDRFDGSLQLHPRAEGRRARRLHENSRRHAGVETRGTLLFTYGVAAGRITAERMADVLAETPAKLYGLFPRKGVLQPGADADIGRI